MAEAGGPVRDGQPGIVAGDQPAGNNQQESQSGNKQSKAMMSGVIRGQNCSLRVPTILASDLSKIPSLAREPCSRYAPSQGFFMTL
jgi:hypothetical protein